MNSPKLKSLIHLSLGDPGEKTQVTMDLHLFGRDFLLLIGGGEAHIGAVACTNEIDLEHFTLKGHMEGELVDQVLREMAEVTEREIMVIGGIHYEQIQASQIEQILENVQGLTVQMKGELSALKLDFHNQ